MAGIRRADKRSIKRPPIGSEGVTTETLRDTTVISADESVTVAYGGKDPRIVCGLPEGGRICLLTDYTCSIVDFIVAIAEEAAPCTLDILTWSANPEDIRTVQNLVTRGLVSRLRLIIDRGARSLNLPTVQLIEGLIGAGNMREISSHAKVFVADGGPGRRWVGQASMNLNRNPRIENLDVSRNDDIAGMYGRFMDMTFEVVTPGDQSGLAAYGPMADELMARTIQASGQAPAVVDPMDAILADL